MIISLIVAIITIVGMWKMFEKAGLEGWKAIIPFYNAYKLFEIAWGNGWLFLLCFVPIANIVVTIMCYVKLANAFQKSGVFAVGLLFVPVVFFPILGFDDSTYLGPQ